MASALCPVDKSVPALIVKIGNYPLHHGGVGVIRSLGRLGVPVYAITEDRFTPAAVSRYLRGRFVWPTTGLEEPEWLVEGLHYIGRRIGRPTVLVPTDEEAAVLIAEHADLLGDRFLFPRMQDTGLCRRLANKAELYRLCTEYGVPTPATVAPESRAEVEKFAASARFPVMVKNREAYLRRRAPAVPNTTRVTSSRGLLLLARGWGERPGVILQEYLPGQHAEDWIVHAYVNADSTSPVLCTGVKVSSWPPHAGMTVYAYVVPNAELALITAEFCKRIGFHGIADLDWRYDRRDGRYKLLDFNPRVGAQFRLFTTEADVDVVRAQHLDLTGRQIPAAAQRNGRRFIVENLGLPTLLAYRGCAAYRSRNGAFPQASERATETELAWFAPDDLRPFVMMIGRMLRPGSVYLRHAWRTRRHAARKDRI